MLASTLDPSASEINEALSVTYKLLFILSKNIVPSRSYRYIRDRTFPVTRLPPPIYTKFDVKQRYIYQCAGKRTFATPKPNPNPPKPSFFQRKSFKSPKNSKNRVCLQKTLYQVVTNRPKSRFSATEKIGFLIK